jgi:hypothetical protein
MAMSYEDRQQFLLMFKQTYDTSQILGQLKREEELND